MDDRTIFWDVDTQYDFLMPDGRLYVPGADQIILVISDLRAMALDRGCSIIASTDWHSVENPEISDTPDYQQTFPPHCMAGTPGAERVGYLGDLPIDVIDPEPMDAGELARLAEKEHFHIVIRKGAINPFSNPNTARLVELVSPGKIIMFGVALDFCVLDTLQSLARFPGIQLVLVRDATKGLGARPDEEVLEELRGIGVEIAESSRLHEMVPCG
jgi:nicotinamidase/pyrazinamidase